MNKKCSVKPSPVAGFGLFAERDFIPGEIVTRYGGVFITEEDFHKFPSEYVYKCTDGSRTDASVVMYPMDEQGRWLNDARGTLFENNCGWYESLPDLFVVTFKDVKKGEEFFINYGDQYWERRSDDPNLKKKECAVPTEASLLS